MRPHFVVEIFIQLPCSIKLPHPILLNFLWSPLIVLVSIHHDWVVLSIIIGFCLHLSNLRIAKVQVVELFLVKIAFTSLLGKLGGHDLVFHTSLHFSLALHLIIKVAQINELYYQTYHSLNIKLL